MWVTDSSVSLGRESGLPWVVGFALPGGRCREHLDTLGLGWCPSRACVFGPWYPAATEVSTELSRSVLLNSQTVTTLSPRLGAQVTLRWTRRKTEWRMPWTPRALRSRKASFWEGAVPCFDVFQPWMLWRQPTTIRKPVRELIRLLIWRPNFELCVFWWWTSIPLSGPVASNVFYMIWTAILFALTGSNPIQKWELLQKERVRVCMLCVCIACWGRKGFDS